MGRMRKRRILDKQHDHRIVGKWHVQGPLSVARAADGCVAVRGKTTDGEQALMYLPKASWQEFLDGVKNGEFDPPSDRADA